MTDRRVRRTRALLRRALISLIVEKGYDRITVQDILDRADVGRSTFYAHYQSKDELLLSGLDDLRPLLSTSAAAGPSEPGPPSLPALLPLFQHAERHRTLTRAMFGRRGTMLALTAGRVLVSQMLSAHLEANVSDLAKEQIPMLVAFLVDGLVGLITWWVDQDDPIPATEIHARFERLALGGIGAFARGAG